jgi:hydroxyacyl-ACP dehydratase HTD2-like protein with hotdog domain
MSEQVISWLNFDQVGVGAELPPLVRVPTTVSLFRFAAVTWQSHLVHFDQAAAAREGYPGVLVQASLHGAYLAQLMTRWVHPSGRLSTLEWRNRRYATAGEQLTMRAVVTRRAVDAEHGLVECALTEENGRGEVISDGKATVTLPRGGGL